MPFQKRESMSSTFRNMLINQKSGTELGQKKVKGLPYFFSFPTFLPLCHVVLVVAVKKMVQTYDIEP